MFQFTNRFGDAVDAPTEVDEVDASDIKYLPLWVAAAAKAQAEGYCDHYDRIANAVGGPTRDELAQAGLMPSEYVVTLKRRVPIVVWVDQQTDVAVMANTRAEAETKALMPNVAYWAGGMYGTDIITKLSSPYAYHGLFVDADRPFGEAEAIPAPSVEDSGI